MCIALADVITGGMERVLNLFGKKSLIMNISFFNMYRFAQVLFIWHTVKNRSLGSYFFHCSTINVIYCNNANMTLSLVLEVIFGQFSFELHFSCACVCQKHARFFLSQKLSTVCESVCNNMCLNVWKSMLWLYRIEHVIDFFHKLFLCTETWREDASRKSYCNNWSRYHELHFLNVDALIHLDIKFTVIELKYCLADTFLMVWFLYVPRYYIMCRKFRSATLYVHTHNDRSISV